VKVVVRAKTICEAIRQQIQDCYYLHYYFRMMTQRSLLLEIHV
jgi:hypothetical protein